MTDYYFEAGTHTSLDDFFSKLTAFCTSASIDSAYRFTAGASNGTAGTSVNTAGAASGTTYAYKRFSMTRGGYYWLARYHSTGGVYCMPSPNDANAVWNSTTGKPVSDYQISPIMAGGNYAFHQYKTSIHAVCILPSGVHLHLNFGTLNKVGSWTGGEYFTGNYHALYAPYVDGDPTASRHCFSFHNSESFRTASAQMCPIMRVDYNSKLFAGMDYSQTAPESGYNVVGGNGIIGSKSDASGAGQTLALRPEFSPNHYAPFRSPGFPIEYQLLKNADDNLWYDLGTVDGARFVNMKWLNAGDVINSDWVVYPLSIKGVTGSVGNYASSADYGIAYYKGP